MKRCLILCFSLGLSATSCDKHDALKQEFALLDATIQKEQVAVVQLDQRILSLGGLAGAEKLRLQLEQVRARTSAIEGQNATSAKKWADIEAEFARLKPAAEAYKTAQPR